MNKEMFWALAGVAAYFTYGELKKKTIIVSDTAAQSIANNESMSLDIFNSLGYTSTGNGRYLEQVQKLKREELNHVDDLKRRYVDRHSVIPDIFDEQVIGHRRQIRDRQMLKDASAFDSPQPLRGTNGGQWYKDALQDWNKTMVNESPGDLPKI